MAEIDRRISSLETNVQSICRSWLDLCSSLIDDTNNGIITITETRRSIERQKELVAAGRSSTMQSKHIDGLAWDFAIIENGKMVADGEDWRYTLCGLAARVLGAHWPIHLASGAKDADHIEVRTA